MPKSKKAKTSHNKHNRDRPLTQAEIWDDSALIRSWDEAVKEYEHYHSIHARGEDLEEVLKRAEIEKEGKGGVIEMDDAEEGNSRPTEVRPVVFGPAAPDDDEVEDGEIDNSDLRSNGFPADPIPDANVVGGARADAAPAAKSLGPNRPKSANFPPELRSNDQAPQTDAGGFSVALPQQDQTLENIKMAYWWAGYYSGLYEGQKQAGQG